ALPALRQGRLPVRAPAQLRAGGPRAPGARGGRGGAARRARDPDVRVPPLQVAAAPDVAAMGPLQGLGDAGSAAPTSLTARAEGSTRGNSATKRVPPPSRGSCHRRPPWSRTA